VNEHETHQRDEDERLTALITDHQRCLYLYIYSLVHRNDDATDVLQETNLALWRDAERSLAVADFRPWAYRVAYHQVLAHRKRQSRNRLHFDDSLLNQLAGDAQASAEQSGDYHDALRCCSQKLPSQNRRLLALRYVSALSIRSIAEQVGSTTAAVSQSLHRIRGVLLKCIQKALAGESPRREERP
jgi:RNA polymerase sigma-70 factor (ECF subfamily)